jgi:putative membrane protein
MSKIKTWKRLLGGSTAAALLAMLSATTAVQAQSNQNPSTGAAGQSEARSTAGTAATAAGNSGVSGQTGSAADTAAAGQPAAAKMSKDDQRMMVDLAKANMAEVEASQMAQGKSQNEQVKSFAQQMITDHTKALQEVQQIAQAKGVTLPTEPDAKHKAMSARMAALSGDEFDRRYMEQTGVKDHKATHALLKKIQSKAKDPDLKALAARMQPAVDQHLANVTQLNASMKSSTRAGSSGTSGSTGSGEQRNPPDMPATGKPDMAPGSSGSSGTTGSSGTSDNPATSGSPGSSGNPATSGNMGTPATNLPEAEGNRPGNKTKEQ